MHVKFNHCDIWTTNMLTQKVARNDISLLAAAHNKRSIILPSMVFFSPVASKQHCTTIINIVNWKKCQNIFIIARRFLFTCLTTHTTFTYIINNSFASVIVDLYARFMFLYNSRKKTPTKIHLNHLRHLFGGIAVLYTLRHEFKIVNGELSITNRGLYGMHILSYHRQIKHTYMRALNDAD